MIGVFVNVLTVLIGSTIGLLFKKGQIIRKMPESELLAALKDELDHWND
jgi:(E)-4-hydroxy-3-methylbut-2-enyl-diphosphate synthase